MSLHTNAPLNSVDGDASSGSEEKMNIIDGHTKHDSAVPSKSGRQKRGRKAVGDAIVDAMLEIAAASKMRAAAIANNENRFSISKCIKVLDEMQDTTACMEDFDIELDELELVAAAVGYHYYSSMNKQPPRHLSTNRASYMTELMEGPEDACRELLRMDKHVFHKLCGIFRERGMLRDTAGVSIAEQLAIFLNIIGHNERNRVVQDRFQHSGETISRHFNNVLKAIKSLSRLHWVIDGMHIPANVPAKDQTRFRNKKGSLSQNVLAACTFDLQFIFVYPGWEGSASDSRILQAVLDDPDQKFPHIPEGKYYLVDGSYLNMEGFIAPFEGVRYSIHEFKGANCLPRNVQELFNHRHATLQQAISRTFHVLKERFPILNFASQYGFQVQRDIVIAACVVHNFIRQEDCDDWLFSKVEDQIFEGTSDAVDPSDMQSVSPEKEQMGMLLRDLIANSMWNDFMNEWNEW